MSVEGPWAAERYFDGGREMWAVRDGIFEIAAAVPKEYAKLIAAAPWLYEQLSALVLFCPQCGGEAKTHEPCDYCYDARRLLREIDG